MENKNKEVVELLVKIGTTMCSPKTSLNIAGHEVLEHATNIGKLQDLINKINAGELVVAEPTTQEVNDASKTDTGK